MDVATALKRDIDLRIRHGAGTYGRTKMETGDGRNALRDAYEEAVDLCLYLKKELMERDERDNDK